MNDKTDYQKYLELSEEDRRFHDLKISCYHEYGHLIVAHYLGYYGEVKITPNQNYDPHKVGGSKYFHGVFRHPKSETVEESKMIGVAGAVAQYFAQNDTDIHKLKEIKDFYDLDTWLLESLQLSDTDIQSMGGDYGEAVELDTVIKVVEILQEKWDDFIGLVEYEISIQE